MDVNTSNEMIVRIISHNSHLYSSKEFILKKERLQGNRWGFQLLTLGKAVSMKEVQLYQDHDARELTVVNSPS